MQTKSTGKQPAEPRGDLLKIGPPTRRETRTAARVRIASRLCITRSERISQCDKIARMLREAAAEHRAVGVPEMMKAGIANYNGRIMELRRRGWGIENDRWHDEEGQLHSQYWLTYDPGEEAL
jgi:Helix-turn-helix domain